MRQGKEGRGSPDSRIFLAALSQRRRAHREACGDWPGPLQASPLLSEARVPRVLPAVTAVLSQTLGSLVPRASGAGDEGRARRDLGRVIPGGSRLPGGPGRPSALWLRYPSSRSHWPGQRTQGLKCEG